MVSAGCADIEIHVQTYKVNEIVSEMKVDLKVPDGNYNLCKVTKTAIEYREDKHYFCNETRKYGCFDNIENENGTLVDIHVADLILHTFEFEGNADPSKAALNKFSSEPEHCC